MGDKITYIEYEKLLDTGKKLIEIVEDKEVEQKLALIPKNSMKHNYCFKTESDELGKYYLNYKALIKSIQDLGELCKKIPLAYIDAENISEEELRKRAREEKGEFNFSTANFSAVTVGTGTTYFRETSNHNETNKNNINKDSTNPDKSSDNKEKNTDKSSDNKEKNPKPIDKDNSSDKIKTQPFDNGENKNKDDDVNKFIIEPEKPKNSTQPVYTKKPVSGGGVIPGDSNILPPKETSEPIIKDPGLEETPKPNLPREFGTPITRRPGTPVAEVKKGTSIATPVLGGLAVGAASAIGAKIYLSKLPEEDDEEYEEQDNYTDEEDYKEQEDYEIDYKDEANNKEEYLEFDNNESSLQSEPVKYSARTIKELNNM